MSIDFMTIEEIGGVSAAGWGWDPDGATNALYIGAGAATFFGPEVGAVVWGVGTVALGVTFD